MPISDNRISRLNGDGLGLRTSRTVATKRPGFVNVRPPTFRETGQSAVAFLAAPFSCISEAIGNDGISAGDLASRDSVRTFNGCCANRGSRACARSYHLPSEKRAIYHSGASQGAFSTGTGRGATRTRTPHCIRSSSRPRRNGAAPASRHACCNPSEAVPAAYQEWGARLLSAHNSDYLP